MKNKKGKKLVVLGAMAALLTLIGVSGSQTYAKYVESTTVDGNTATVAKWGFVQTGNAANLFGTQYEAGAAKLSTVITDDDTSTMTISKKTSSGNVVAPGSTGSFTYTLTGMAEVDFEVSFTYDDLKVSDISLDDKNDSTKAYYPLDWNIQITASGCTPAFAAVNFDGDLSTCLAKLGSFHFNAGSDCNISVTLTWKWEFENTKAIELEFADSTPLTNDDADTILGLLAGDHVATNNIQYGSTVLANFEASLEVGFEDLKIKVEQVQNNA